MKSKLEYASHKTSQTIFFGFVTLFIFIVVTTAVNFFTQGAVVEFLARFDKKNVIGAEATHTLTIGTAAPIKSLNPLNFEFQNRLALNNAYEGLVSLDPSLQVKQSLAVTFGQLDDTMWEFRLREGVKFHNGSELSGNDVMQSFRSAMEDSSSQLKSVLSNIEDITANSGKIQIRTKKPDPTFLNKLATVYIYKDFDNGERYGTGPYVLGELKGDQVSLTRFEDYWGAIPTVEEAAFLYVKDKEERLKLFTNGGMDIMRNVPSPLLSKINAENSIIIKQPSLEVTFLGFGFEATEIFKDPAIVQAVEKAIDRDRIADTFGNAVLPARQFVSNGVVGYLPGLEMESSNEDLGINIINKYNSESGEVIDVTLDYSKELKEVANSIQKDLQLIGITVKLRPLGQKDLITTFRSGKSQMYLLGWKSEFGDAIDLYKVIAHSKKGRLGGFNAGNYSNSRVDELISQSDNTFNPLERVKTLQQIMELILVKQPMGIPLFETQVTYAIQKDINFIPRIDGYMYVSEVR